MTKEGVLTNPAVDAVFGLHISSDTDVGTIDYRSGPIMASVQDFRIVVNGKQSHGAYPSGSIDPIVTASQIVTALQTVVSRSIDLTENPAVVSVGSFPRRRAFPTSFPKRWRCSARFVRSIRTKGLRCIGESAKIATHIAASAGATADVEIPYSTDYPLTYNDPEFAASAIESLQQGRRRRQTSARSIRSGGAEDFSFFQEEVPGFYFFLGGKPLDVAVEDAAPTPYAGLLHRREWPVAGRKVVDGANPRLHGAEHRSVNKPLAPRVL